ncbi:hypothetical protein ANN_27637 [Periplaneta americana]|uniref:Uncharacterized protein n=1 Tax=Periplaneta americana TaxID=6978 RepID=A0ABQ8RWF8_PERAM|nr:hypothetical protein ANN_27637 [Periplaneta americana]
MLRVTRVFVVMDVIKMEPEVDRLDLQPYDNTYKTGENEALPEVSSTKRSRKKLPKLQVKGMKTECLDHSCDLTSQMNTEDTQVPVSFAVMKCEGEDSLMSGSSPVFKSEVEEYAFDLDRFQQAQKVEVSSEEDEVLTESIVDVENSVLQEYTGIDGGEDKWTQCGSHRPDGSDITNLSRKKLPKLEVVGLKTECLDHSCDFTSQMNVEDTQVPVSFAVMKCEGGDTLMSVSSPVFKSEVEEYAFDLDRYQKAQKVEVSSEEDEVLTESIVDVENSVLQEYTGIDGGEDKWTQCGSHRPDGSDITNLSTDNAGEMSLRSSTESYLAFARIGLRENPGKNLNQVTCPDRVSNPGHLVLQPDALTVTPQIIIGAATPLFPSCATCRIIIGACSPDTPLFSSCATSQIIIGACSPDTPLFSSCATCRIICPAFFIMCYTSDHHRGLQPRYPAFFIMCYTSDHHRGLQPRYPAFFIMCYMSDHHRGLQPRYPAFYVMCYTSDHHRGLQPRYPSFYIMCYTSDHHRGLEPRYPAFYIMCYTSDHHQGL